jgi:RNA polymerase sigma factor (sigma-70 family)
MDDEQTRLRFEALMLPLMNDAYTLARWLMKNQEDAEDMVQESYMRAFRFFPSFQGTNGRGWLLQIVRKICYTALESRELKQKEAALEEEPEGLEDPAPLPFVSLDKKATTKTVREAIEALAADFREVIVLREVEGLSYKESQK